MCLSDSWEKFKSPDKVTTRFDGKFYFYLKSLCGFAEVSVAIQEIQLIMFQQ